MDALRLATDRLRASAPYRALASAAAAGERVRVVRLPIPAAAWVIDRLRRELERPVLVLVPHEGDALAWVQAATLFGGTEAALHFPAPSLSPYAETETSLAVRALEAATLDRLLDRPKGAPAPVVVANPRALFRLLPPAPELARVTLVLRRDEDHPIDELVAHLLRFGYRRVDVVSEVGEVAVRGGLLDVFPPGDADPLRIELFGDTVESIRRFDAASQRSADSEPEARLLPLSLFPAGQQEAIALAGLIADGLGGADSALREDVEEHLVALRERGRFPGWEGWLAVLAPAHATLLELMASGGRAPLVVAVDPPTLAREVEQHADRLAADHALRLAHRHLALPPELLEHPRPVVEAALAAANIVSTDLVLDEHAPVALPSAADGAGGPAIGVRVDFRAAATDLFHGQLPRFPTEVAAARARGEEVLLLAPAGHHNRLADLLAGRDIARGPGGVELVDGELERGFRLPAAGVSLFAEGQLLPRGLVGRPPSGGGRRNPFLSTLRDLKVGDYVVHAEHGIGQFVALRSVAATATPDPNLPAPLRAEAAVAGGATEVMEISYAGGRRLLLPLTRLDQVQKYGGIEGVSPRLDQLGGSSWSKAKAKVKAGLRQMADELLKLYAERQMATAPPMEADGELVSQFAAAFPYEETADQLEAIAAIAKDLESNRPMDRLLCGDVGFGKTEVAMRAAMKVVASGFQVAVLAPTTILADQHLETFRRRFAGLPVTVELVSRIRSNAEMKEIRTKLRDKKIDVLVGTHRLLAKDLEIPHLGLLVVDEEQRFGVAQKERLKQLKKNVHVLAMSATPVPRTLQLSLAGVRDLSVIETPPRDRMAVETAILGYDDRLVREAIEYELERGGQVYYVYNRVEGIEVIQHRLRELLPELRITVGHGQMEEHELERRMHAFIRGDYDLLLATTIIENGIDIPNVNTMIVHHADRFGLAQLYQLRGRVGRSSQLGFCYLLVEQDRVLSEQARKRLAALREFSDLGAGFRIAARDLEIRGAGNLLGAEQSGHIASVGIETYLKLLEEAVRELRGEIVEEAPSATIDLPVEVGIPTDYVADANLRLELYRRIADGTSGDEELLAELADRFGEPPAAVRRLLVLAAVKREAERLRVQSIAAQGGKLLLRLRRDARVNVDRLLAMVTNRPGTTFSPSGVLTLELGEGEVLPTLRDTLAELAA
jgi:transcription-repair coupling factor (superfamily II helicase)